MYYSKTSSSTDSTPWTSFTQVEYSDEDLFPCLTAEGEHPPWSLRRHAEYTKFLLSDSAWAYYWWMNPKEKQAFDSSDSEYAYDPVARLFYRPRTGEYVVE